MIEFSNLCFYIYLVYCIRFHLSYYIEPNQTSLKSSFAYEMPVNPMMLDNVYQNQSTDKPDKPFFSHIDYNLNGKPESPKTISTLKKNSGDEEALPFTSWNLAPSNCTSENKTIELNKIIEPKQSKHP